MDEVPEEDPGQPSELQLPGMASGTSVPAPSQSKLVGKLLREPSREPVEKPSREPLGKPSREPLGKPSREPLVKASTEPLGKASTEPMGKPSKEPFEKLLRGPSAGSALWVPNEVGGVPGPSGSRSEDAGQVMVSTTSVATRVPTPSQATDAPPDAKPLRKASNVAGQRMGTPSSQTPRTSASTLSGRAGGPRHRSLMSMPSRATSRGSLISRASRVTTTSTVGTFDYGLPLELQQLIARLVDAKDAVTLLSEAAMRLQLTGLIAYLSAIPGEPLHGGRPVSPPAAKAQSKPSHLPKSIMKISKAQVRVEPTYRLEPVRPFRWDRADAVVKGALLAGLASSETAAYSEQWAADACRILAAYITQSIKALDTQRYKIATLVTVMERQSQGVRSDLRTLWDAERDLYCSACVQTSSLIASAVVFAVYCD